MRGRVTRKRKLQLSHLRVIVLRKLEAVQSERDYRGLRLEAGSVEQRPD